MRRSPMAEPQTKAAVECRMIAPQFVVPNVVAAAEYYRDVLGFQVRGYFLDPPVYAIVARDSVEIHFGRADTGSAASPNIQRHAGSLDAYIWVNDLDPLYAELKERGAKKSSNLPRFASTSATKWSSRMVSAFDWLLAWI